MGITRSERRIRFYWTGAYILSIYISLPFVSDLVKFLRAENLLRLAVLIIFLTAFNSIYWFMTNKMKIPMLKSLLYLAFMIGTYSFVFLLDPRPEEWIHFLQYGILPVLFMYSLEGLIKPVNQYIGAFSASSVVGTLDEIIQYYLPNRVFDWHDIGFNYLAAAMGLLFYFLFSRLSRKQ